MEEDREQKLVQSYRIAWNQVGRREGRCSYEFLKELPENIPSEIDVPALQQRVLEKGDALQACYFACDVPGADIRALQSRVLEVGDGWEAFLFSRLVPGADIELLQHRVLEVGTSREILHFAQLIPGADIPALQQRLLEMDIVNEWDLLSFARLVPGADVLALKERACKRGGVELVDAFDENFPNAVVPDEGDAFGQESDAGHAPV